MAYVVREKRFNLANMEWASEGRSRVVSKHKTRVAAEQQAFDLGHREESLEMVKVFFVEKT